MIKGRLKKYYIKIKECFYLADSKEYQRTVAGISIYFNLMKQRTFMNYLFVTLFMCIFLLFIIFWVNILEGAKSISTTIHDSISITSFFIIMMISLFFFSIWLQHDFKIKKGIKIFLLNPFSFYFTFVFILMIILSFFQNQSPLTEIITSIFTISILLIMILLALSFSFLKPESLLKYGIEKIKKTTATPKNKRFNKSNYYIQYYYAILTYYKMVTRSFRGTYKDDVLVRTKCQLIPLLCTQGLVINSVAKKKLINNLENLSKINPTEDPNKFTKEMEQIDKNLLSDINKEEKKRIFDLLRDKTGKERIREYLYYLFIISAIVNIFFREAILNLVGDLF